MRERIRETLGFWRLAVAVIFASAQGIGYVEPYQESARIGASAGSAGSAGSTQAVVDIFARRAQRQETRLLLFAAVVAVLVCVAIYALERWSREQRSLGSERAGLRAALLQAGWGLWLACAVAMIAVQGVTDDPFAGMPDRGNLLGTVLLGSTVLALLMLGVVVGTSVRRGAPTRPAL